MKNKKSKIIVPALGLILLSTAASISGSVAWFTASRSATVNTGAFSVIKTDGNLAPTLSYGVGTVVDGTTINPLVDNTITAAIGDVSFNPATHQLYTDNGDGGISGYRTIGGTDIYDDQPATDGKGTHLYKINNTTYYAFTWKVTLTYTWGADTSPLNVFFDYSGSSMGSTDANTTDTGLRIAMIASRTVVYAGLQTAANLKGVYGTAAATDPEDVATSAMAAYGTTNLNSTSFSYFASNGFAKGDTAAASIKTSYSKAIDGESGQNGREDYLGQITHSGASDHIDIYCVAWYEGTDPNVVNNKTLDSVTSTLKFYATI